MSEPARGLTRMPVMLRALCILGFVIMAGSIVWALTQAPFWPSVEAIMANPWGVVTVIDLYLGFFIFAIVLWRFEPNRAIALAAVISLPFLGNVVTLAWLGWRGLGLIQPRA